MMGRVLLRMVVSKTKDEEEKDLTIFGDLTDLADRLAKDFVVKVGYRTCANHKYFWRADFWKGGGSQKGTVGGEGFINDDDSLSFHFKINN